MIMLMVVKIIGAISKLTYNIWQHKLTIICSTSELIEFTWPRISWMMLNALSTKRQTLYPLSA